MGSFTGALGNITAGLGLAANPVSTANNHAQGGLSAWMPTAGQTAQFWGGRPKPSQLRYLRYLLSTLEGPFTNRTALNYILTKKILELTRNVPEAIVKEMEAIKQ